MKLYVIVGENKFFNNISARAVYSTREAAETHLKDPDCMWFDDRAEIVELTLDAEGTPRNVALELALKQVQP